MPAARRILGGGGIYNFKAEFNWAILKINLKVTLLQFSGLISQIMVRFQKLKNRLSAQDLLYQFIFGTLRVFNLKGINLGQPKCCLILRLFFSEAHMCIVLPANLSSISSQSGCCGQPWVWHMFLEKAGDGLCGLQMFIKVLVETPWWFQS